MIDQIKEIHKWNEIAENNNFDRHLEVSMLWEEFAETLIAMKEWDKAETIDGIIDLFIVWMGTLKIMWIQPECIAECYQEIMSSNYTKFIDELWELKPLKVWGKVAKPSTYVKPNIKKIIEKYWH